MTPRPQLGIHHIPDQIEVDIDGDPVSVDPVAWAPVRRDSPEGEVARFPRALCRLDDGDRAGVGWIELNQPPGFVLGR